jgi:hypothetical protein
VDLLRGLVAESRVETSRIVEQFDVAGNIPSRVFPGRVLGPMYPLSLQRREERFRQSVVIADTGPPDRLANVEPTQNLSVLGGGVIASRSE